MKTKISAPNGMRGLAVEPWTRGEVYAVAADWAQASCPVRCWGDGEWVLDEHGRQVADFRHDAVAALEDLLRESIIDSGDEPDDDEIDSILSRAEEVLPDAE